MRPAFIALLLALVVAAPARAIETRVGEAGIAFSDGGRVVFEGGRLEIRSLGLWADAGTPQVTSAGGVVEATYPAARRCGRHPSTPASRASRSPATGDGVRVSFATAPGERFLGFGERSDAVVRAGGDVDNRVTEGPYQDVESPFVAGFVPLPGQNSRARRDVLPDPVAAVHARRRASWSATTTTRVFRARRAVERGGRRRRHDLRGLRRADARGRAAALQRARRPPAARRRAVLLRPVVAAEGRRGGEPRRRCRRRARRARSSRPTRTTCRAATRCTERERERTERFHAAGLAVTTYFNPMVCTSHTPRYDPAVGGGRADQGRARQPVHRTATRARACSSSASTTSPPRPAGAVRRRCSTRRSRTATTAGWRTSASTRPTTRAPSDGSTGAAGHNRYVVDYHAAAHAYAHDRAPRRSRASTAPAGPARRSTRRSSGAATRRRAGASTGSSSAVRNGLSHGPVRRLAVGLGHRRLLRAVASAQTTPELMRRWIQFGFASRRHAHAGQRLRAAPVDRARRSPTPTSCRCGRATPGCARSSTRTSSQRPARLRPHRHADDARARARLPGRPRGGRRARTSTCSGPTCSSRRWSTPGATSRTRLPAARAAGSTSGARSTTTAGPRGCKAPVVLDGRPRDRGRAPRTSRCSSAPAPSSPCCRRTSTRSPATARARRRASPTAAGRRAVLAFGRRARIKQPRRRRLDVQMAYAGRTCRARVRMRSGVIRRCRRRSGS